MRIDRRLFSTGLAASLAVGARAEAAPRRRRFDLDEGPDALGADAVDDVPSWGLPDRSRLLAPGADGPYDADDPFGRPRPTTPERRAPADDAVAPWRDLPVDAAGFDYARIYARVDDDSFPIPAFNYRRMSPVFLRQTVIYRGGETPGTVIVDPRARHLLLVLGEERALRYGVGVGRQGFAWSGAATINSKQAWPDWYPPKEMIERDPRLARSLAELRSGIGMHGGPSNPLGARAMYLWQGNKDTLYRIHGTVEPYSIGTRASSGCIRMINQDAMDLYNRVPVGSRVVVLG